MNSIQLFGALLLGGLAAGEASRRLMGLPRTSGYVLFGIAAGQAGAGWIAQVEIESVRLFVDLALGLILFELGHRVSSGSVGLAGECLRVGLLESLLSGVMMFGLIYAMGHPLMTAVFAAALGVSTSPAITIATTSDIGAQGRRTDILMSLVAINGAAAFVVLALIHGVLVEGAWWQKLQRFAGPVLFSLVAGAGAARLLVICARRLGRHVEHQHLLILGFILLCVGTCLQFGVSVLLPLLCLGIGTRLLDSSNDVVAIRISSDARIFLVFAFVVAGASLNLSSFGSHWMAALLFLLVRGVGKFVALIAMRHRLGVDEREARMLSIGLMPMSGVALVLVSESGLAGDQVAAEVQGLLFAAILVMQLLGPLATQHAIRSLGEATRLAERRGRLAESSTGR